MRLARVIAVKEKPRSTTETDLQKVRDEKLQISTHKTLSWGERPSCGSALTRTPSIVLQPGQASAAAAGVGVGAGNIPAYSQQNVSN